MNKKDFNIKIFVSNRIDLESEQVSNDLFIPIRCGATFDTRDNVSMLGDNTGDNISEKRNTYCEFTVMYWIWKNIQAEYVGMMHYRRFFSFLDQDIPSLRIRQGILDNMSKVNLESINLLNKDAIKAKIQKYDWLSAHVYDIKEENLGCFSSVMDFWKRFSSQQISQKNLEMMFQIIKHKFPDYYETAMECRNGTKFLAYPCFIGRKELFDKLCEFVFGVMFAAEKQLKNKETHFSEQNMRIIGYMGEWLYTIWVFHFRKLGKYSFGERQLVFFKDTTPAKGVLPLDSSYTIVFPINSSNFPNVAASIQSIVEHTDKKIEFILLTESQWRGNQDDYIMDELKFSLAAYWRDYENVSIRFYDPKYCIGKLEHRFCSEPSRKYLYWLICLPWILKEHTKVLYLSPEIIAQGDVTEIFGEDLQGKSIGAVRDVYFLGTELQTPNLEREGLYTFMKDPWNFCDTDVVVMNLQKLREKTTLEAVTAMLDDKYDGWYTARNFNSIYEDEITLLDFRWNHCALHRSVAFQRMLSYHVPCEIKEKYTAVHKPSLLNFQVRKPCAPIKEDSSMRVYWKYMRKTPFYELALSRMWEATARCEARKVKNALSHPAVEDIYARFVFPWKAVKPGARIVMYGGGIVGKTFIKQLSNNPYCHVITVVDRNPAATGIVEAPVIDINGLSEMDYDMFDLVLIALERKDIAVDVRKDLELMGIPANKIKWVDPHRK